MALARIWAVVPAAGSGRRFGSETAKQYVELAGEPIAQRTLSTLLEAELFSKIIVPVALDDRFFSSLVVAQRKELEVIEGGETRAQSVLNGLSALAGHASSSDWVLVHDIARPLLTIADIQYLLASLAGHPVGGIFALPATDTVKVAVNKNVIDKTVDRQTVWLAQTPQMFRYGLLHQALSLAVEQGLSVTDEASAMEFQQHDVALVKGRVDNIKITHRADIALAEFYLAANEKSQVVIKGEG